MSSSDFIPKLKNLIENDETENFYTILSEIIENNKENFSNLALYLNEVFKLIIEEIDESNCEKKLSFICLFFEILISENIDFSNYLQNIFVIIEGYGIISDENIKRLINICNNATINKKDLFNYLIQFSRNKTEYLYMLYSLDGFKELIVETISYNWELIEELLDNQEVKSNANILKTVLKCLEILIEISGTKFKEYATSAIYKTLNYLTEIDVELQNRSLMILYNLTKYCYEQLEPLKEKIIEFLKYLKTICNNSENINICNILLNYFCGENKENKENEENVNNNNNNINSNKEIINENINNNINNEIINEIENSNNPVKDGNINESNNNNNEIFNENDDNIDFNKINEQNYINDQNIEDIKIEEEINKKERENKEYNIQNEVPKEYDDKKDLENYDKEENSDNNEIINNIDDDDNNEEENNNENNEEENNNEHNESENNEEENNNEHNESENNNEHNESEYNNEYNKEENNSEYNKKEYNNNYNKEENNNKYNKEENNSENEDEVMNDEKYNHLKNLIKKEDNYKMKLKSYINKNKKFNLNEIVMKIKDLSDKQIIILETIEQYKRDTKRIINQKKSKIQSLEAKVEELKEEIRIEKNKKRNRIGKTNNQMRRKKVNDNNFENDIDNDYNDYHY